MKKLQQKIIPFTIEKENSTLQGKKGSKETNNHNVIMTQMIAQKLRKGHNMFVNKERDSILKHEKSYENNPLHILNSTSLQAFFPKHVPNYKRLYVPPFFVTVTSNFQWEKKRRYAWKSFLFPNPISIHIVLLYTPLHACKS